MRLPWRRMTRAQALLKAVELSDLGDEVWLHGAECTDPNICTCVPLVLYVGGRRTAPMGFRLQR